MSNSDNNLRFSGHDTFHCKEQWLLKGLQLVDNKDDIDPFKKEESISELGVGKNMVRSIQYWLKSFGLVDEQNNPTELAQLIFLNEKLDPYLENEGTLWLLQYLLCYSKYASIYNLIFADYFSDKANHEFSESQILRHIDSLNRSTGQKTIATKTLETDYRVFLRTYVSPPKNNKSVEDDFNVPLISLGLVSDSGRKNDLNQSVFRLNVDARSFPIEIFLFCVLNQFPNEVSIDFEDIRKTVGYYLCITDDHLDYLLRLAADSFNDFVYKEDAGNREFGLKNKRKYTKVGLLKKYYESL
jgi:hypothetical protein